MLYYIVYIIIKIIRNYKYQFIKTIKEQLFFKYKHSSGMIYKSNI